MSKSSPDTETVQHEEEFFRLIRSLLTDVATSKLGVTSSRANDLLHKLKHLNELRAGLAPTGQQPYAVEYRIERDGHLYSHMHAGQPPEGAQDVRWLYLANSSTDRASK